MATGFGPAAIAAEPPALRTGECGSCQSPPVPGANLPQTPAPRADAAPKFRLTDVRFNGAAAIEPERLRNLARPYIGREVSLAELQALAQAVQAEYRARGYFLAQALVPVQTVQNGVVEISVIEGRLGRITSEVAPDAPISEARVAAFLKPLEAGRAVNAPDYERAMLLLSDQPGIRVTSGLQQGLEVGTTDLSVEVAPANRWQFTAEADNHGTKESGRYRFGGTARWLSPLGIGDNLDLRVLLSNSNALQFGRLAYEAPIGGNGLRAGIAASRVRYELGGQFEALGAQGRADVLDLSLNYPLIRQRSENLFLRLGAQVKNLTDELQALNFSSDKRTRGVSLGWAWERRDAWLGGGYLASSGTLYWGNLSIRDEASRDADGGAGGRGTAGGFAKLGFQLSRLQAIKGSHSLYLALTGQLASKNLDASEKVALGGSRAVRAYPTSEVLVDQGVIGAVEWRWAVTPELTPFVFYDAAHGRIVRNPLATDSGNSRNLRGAGLGVSWSRPRNFSIGATLAWRAGTSAAVTDGGGRNPRLYVQLQKVF
ncbi:MAG: ShlB/FhaC/HecB family hemolysin secretion/activation protein [Burkholderiales bacterium]